MEEALIGARIRDILERKIMGAGDMESAVDDLTEMFGGVVVGAYGTRQGALKGWATRRRKAAAKKRKTSGSKRSTKKRVSRKSSLTRKAACARGLKSCKTRLARGQVKLCEPSTRCSRILGINPNKYYRTKSTSKKAAHKIRLARRKKRGGVVLGAYGTRSGARKNPWIKFLAKFRRENPDLSPQEVMQEASLAWKGCN